MTQFLRKARLWWDLDSLGKLAGITFNFGALIVALVAANSLFLKANIKVSGIAAQYTINESMVKVFYHDHSKFKKPPAILVGLIHDINSSQGLVVNYERNECELLLGHFPDVHDIEFREHTCSDVVDDILDARGFPRYEFPGLYDPLLASYALRASISGEVSVKLTNNGLGTAKEISAIGPAGLQEQEKTITLENGETAVHLFDVKGNGKRPLTLLDNELDARAFAVTWRNEPSRLTNLIAVSIAGVILLIIVWTTLVDIQRTPLQQVAGVEKQDNPD